jgi:hypothetical protein
MVSSSPDSPHEDVKARDARLARLEQRQRALEMRLARIEQLQQKEEKKADDRRWRRLNLWCQETGDSERTARRDIKRGILEARREGRRTYVRPAAQWAAPKRKRESRSVSALAVRGDGAAIAAVNPNFPYPDHGARDPPS